jgi:hypothetical protein
MLFATRGRSNVSAAANRFEQRTGRNGVVKKQERKIPHLLIVIRMTSLLTSHRNDHHRRRPTDQRSRGEKGVHPPPSGTYGAGASSSKRRPGGARERSPLSSRFDQRRSWPRADRIGSNGEPGSQLGRRIRTVRRGGGGVLCRWFQFLAVIRYFVSDRQGTWLNQLQLYGATR